MSGCMHACRNGGAAPGSGLRRLVFEYYALDPLLARRVRPGGGGSLHPFPGFQSAVVRKRQCISADPFCPRAQIVPTWPAIAWAR